MSVQPASGFGTPFDLNDLTADPLVLNGLLDLNNIQFLRPVDIPGNGSFADSQGNPIRDNWLTNGSGGFDFRLGMGNGVGVLNSVAVPEPTSVSLFASLALALAYRHRLKRSSANRQRS